MKILRHELDGIQGDLKKITNFSDLKIDFLKSSKNEIEIFLNFSKTQNSINIKGEINSAYSEICDRCINNFNHDKIAKFRVILTQNENLINNRDSEFILLDESKNEIDLSNIIRDTLLLEKPMKSICDEKCKGLCSNCGKNLNFETCKCIEN